MSPLATAQRSLPATGCYRHLPSGAQWQMGAVHQPGGPEKPEGPGTFLGYTSVDKKFRPPPAALCGSSGGEVDPEEGDVT